MEEENLEKEIGKEIVSAIIEDAIEKVCNEKSLALARYQFYRSNIHLVTGTDSY